MRSIEQNYTEIARRIKAAAAGRLIKLIAVTKTFPAERVREAYAAGIRIFGENRIQEAVPKIQATQDIAPEWHFIGHLQTNKAREAVRYFSWIQSIDSVRLLQQVEKEAAGQRKNMDVLLEINLGGEETKHGFTEATLPAAFEEAPSLQWCRVRGLMIIPPYYEDPEEVRAYFRRLRELQEKHLERIPHLTELSMGMSHDFEVAVQEGATMVRIGTALFGERDPKP